VSAGDERIGAGHGGGGDFVNDHGGGGGGDGRDEHLEWRISALLDGELTEPEESVAREHLSGCDVCQQEFAEVMAARNMLRALGEVEPPVGTLDRVVRRIVRRRQITGIGILGLVTLTIAWVLLLFLVVRVSLPTITPPVTDFVRVHDQLSTSSERAPQGFVALDDPQIASLEAPYVAPETVGSLERSGVYRKDGTVLVRYRGDSGARLSVFEQVGVLHPRAFPSESRVRVDGHLAVLTSDESGKTKVTVLVLPRRPLVYTVIASGTGDAFEAGSNLPAAHDFSLGDRIRRNVRDAISFFGGDGSS
jgi:hypothetical protein